MRKHPTQQRASDMVAILIEAAALEIGERGLDALTTNHIARRAGVSVGSLYQYFGNKEMIVEALLMQRAGRLMAVVHARVAPLLGADIGHVTRAVLQGIFEQVEGDPAQRELLRHWHRLDSAPVFRTLEQQMMDVCRQYLMRHFDDYRIDNLPAALFVVINSVLYTTARYLGEAQPLLGREEVIDTLARMVESLCLPRVGRQP